MGRILTKRYSLPNEKTGVRNPFFFIRDVYTYGKLPELGSFIVWELLHKLKLFPQEQYLKFDGGEVLTFANKRLNNSDFDEEIVRFFKIKKLNLGRAHHDWKLLFIRKDDEIFGCLYPDSRNLYKSFGDRISIALVERFPGPIKSIFVSSQNTIFVSANGAVYKRSNSDDSFKKSLDLGSSVSFFRHNNGITETPDKTLIIAEYGNVWENNGWRKLAYLYFSSDDGETWDRSDFLIGEGINKHVHLVKYSRLCDKVLMADGDNKKKLWVSDSTKSPDLQNGNGWRPVNRFHIQMGGYTSVVEVDGKILFGTDYQGGTNFIVETADCEKFTKRIVPDPYRRSPIDNMVVRKSKRGDEIWANLPFSMASTKCLLMYTANGGESWHKVLEYNRATHKVWLLSSSNDRADVLFFSIEDSKNNDRVVYQVSDA